MSASRKTQGTVKSNNAVKDPTPNLNHACQAQNIFVHTLAEQGCGVGIISEPYRIPDGHPCWTGDDKKTVAITWRNIPYSPPCVRRETRKGVVAVDWGMIMLIGVYISPNITLREYEQ